MFKHYRWLVLLFCFVPSALTAQIEQLISPGELSKPHSHLSGVKNCNVCHGSHRDALETKCLECHKDLAARISAGKGFHANKKTKCMTCHTEHLGRNFDIRGLDLKTFRHEETGWKLEGFHAQIKNCASCHKMRSFLGLSTSCQSCHTDPHRGALPTCETCHSVYRPMKQVTFDHSKTRFPLKGAHQTVPCLTCHKNQVFKGLPFANCTSCHQDPHKGTLGTDCTSCHNNDSWNPTGFKHDKFPLLGKHKIVPCQKCHVGGRWKLPAFEKCADCHKDPHLGQFANQVCEDCHTVEGFKPARVNHDKFKLENGHAIPCEKCHKLEKGEFPAGMGSAVRYKPMRTECAACHKDVHGGQFGQKCEQCHTTASFHVKAFDHSKTRFPLDSNHASVPCQKCHVKDATGVIKYKPLATNCAACHKDPHLGQFKQDCEQCHTPKGIRVDHASTKFPLLGKHEKVPCEKCHVREKGQFPAGPGEAIRFKPIATNCKNCHEDYHRGQFKEDCVKCHNPDGFKESTFVHSKSNFELTGAHLRLTCERCHKPEIFKTPPPPVTLVRFKPIPHECAACHKDPHKGQFGTDCQQCHTTSGWSSTSFNHAAQTGIPLNASHNSLRCDGCHINREFKQQVNCINCHRKDYDRSTRPNHRAANFSLNCESCHKVGDGTWEQATLNHDVFFRLAGRHATASCQSCHVNNVYKGTPQNCYGCHRVDYDVAREPNHKSAGFPTTCDSCHKFTDSDWNTTQFNHQQFFPLVGRHATVQCASCHQNGIYKGTPRDCYGCHRSDYESTQNPNHRQAGFSTNCESCHKVSDANWGSGFNHNSVFPLVGRHSTAACASCHKSGVFKGTPRDCIGCHRQDYDSTQNPNHRQAGFSTNCESCHKPTDSSWRGSGFNHSSIFPLSGRHATASCASCHRNAVYKGTPRDCYGCHRQDYDATRRPNHRQSGFPTDCESCHKFTDSDWHRANLNHNQFFPLVGRHASASCESCHRNNVFRGTPDDCYGCHRPDYDSTRNPNHRQSGFSTNCESCHSATDPDWHRADLNHNEFFPLAGRHATASCASCHRNGVYRGTPRDCYGCHRPDYDSTRNPNHRAAGFPTACDNCHRFQDSSWNQARFDHRFPITSGEHAGNPCSACHTNPGNFRTFTCLTCHVRGEMEDEHDDVGGYRYDSPACFACHPNGEKD